MLEFIVKGLKDYGAMGVILAYFLWKDSRTFELFRTTMREIVDEIKHIREEQGQMAKDVDDLKKLMGR